MRRTIQSLNNVLHVFRRRFAAKRLPGCRVQRRPRLLSSRARRKRRDVDDDRARTFLRFAFPCRWYRSSRLVFRWGSE